MASIGKIYQTIRELDYLKDQIRPKATSKEITEAEIENSEKLIRETADLLRVIAHMLKKKATSIDIGVIIN